MTASPDEIKDALRRCETVADVNDCAAHFRREVFDLERSKNATDRTIAIQIKKLAQYRREAIRNRWPAHGKS